MMQAISLSVATLLSLFLHQFAGAAQSKTARLGYSNILSLAKMPPENILAAQFKKYDTADFSNKAPKTLSRYIIKDLEMIKWGNQISEFLSFADLLFSFQALDYQNTHKKAFLLAKKALATWRFDINQEVAKVHPGYSFEFDELKESYKGFGVTIGVVDLFDKDILEKQRQIFAGAFIEPIQKFGNPVSLNHGNSVIDMILAIAPKVRIIPVAVDNAHYTDGLLALQSRDDVLIINLSRAFKLDKKSLDTKFASALLHLLRSKVVVKSLGNTGTDLDDRPTPLRQELGLGGTGSFFAYDTALIKEFLNNDSSQIWERLVLAINYDLYLEQPALSATIPGDFARAQDISFAVGADGVYSPATGNYESGSSFAAPQITGLLALLAEAKSHKRKRADPKAALDALKKTARHFDTRSNAGKGQIQGNLALRALEHFFATEND